MVLIEDGGEHARQRPAPHPRPRKHVVGTADDALCVPGITFADPLLGALGDHGGAVTTVLPGAGSPAIGIGKACPPTDARGKTRKTDGCAAGAAEPD